MRAGDIARADIAMTPERIYYRFATDDSIEDGDLPATNDDFDSLCDRMIAAATIGSDERPIGNDIKVEIFINNRTGGITVSEESLKRLVSELACVADEFAFLNGFC